MSEVILSPRIPATKTASPKIRRLIENLRKSHKPILYVVNKRVTIDFFTGFEKRCQPTDRCLSSVVEIVQSEPLSKKNYYGLFNSISDSYMVWIYRDTASAIAVANRLIELDYETEPYNPYPKNDSFISDKGAVKIGIP
ncbi:MAG: hypothetical protein ACRC62_19670 [Microcoleus sp.]